MDDSDFVSPLSVDNVHFLNVSKQNSGQLLQIAPLMKLPNSDYLPIFIYITEMKMKAIFWHLVLGIYIFLNAQARENGQIPLVL